MSANESEIMTAVEAAAYLRVDVRTLYASVHAGTLPVLRLGATGKTWRFVRSELAKLAGERGGEHGGRHRPSLSRSGLGAESPRRLGRPTRAGLAGSLRVAARD